MDNNQIEQKLQSLKHVYQNTQPSTYLQNRGYADLKSTLATHEQQKRNYFRLPLFSHGLVFAIVLLLFVSTGAYAGVSTMNAVPGQPLYPLKRVSENAYVKITGNTELKAENRAEEIVILAGDKDKIQKLNQVVEEYKLAVKESKKEASPSSKSAEDLRKKLKEHQEKFEKTLPKTPARKQVKEAISVTRQDSVRGVKDRKQEKDYPNNPTRQKSNDTEDKPTDRQKDGQGN